MSTVGDFASAIISKLSALINQHNSDSNAHNGVFVKNNDSRLSDARTPTSHTHGNISNDGKIGTDSGKIITTTTGGVLTSSADLSASKIIDANANNYTNIGQLSSGASQQEINNALNSKIGNIVDFFNGTGD